MGAATAMAFTLEHPERVPALVQITPAYRVTRAPATWTDDTWERMASELDAGGVDAFVEVAQPGDLPEKWREIAREATRQRMERHEDRGRWRRRCARCRARSPGRAWSRWALDVPVLVVGSRDRADPSPARRGRAVRRHCRAPAAVEDRAPRRSPGRARACRAIADFFERVGYAPS